MCLEKDCMKSDQTNSRNQAKPAENSRFEDATDSSRPEDNESSNEEFPGYPHYPAKEDIMHPANRMEKVTPDPEKLTRSGAYLDPKNTDKPVSSSLDVAADTDDDLVIVPGTEADVTREDLIILGEQNLDLDEEEAVDTKTMYGDLEADLDVPGEELDDENEELGEEDEENNYYSLGGDSKENLEEN
jgi:hypothetical protein